MRSRRPHLALHRKPRGFSLIELAIVMAILGLVLGATWVAGASVYEGVRISTTFRDLSILTQNIRTFYKGQNSFSKSSGTDITETMVSADVFPAEMINQKTNLPVTPWGTDVKVYVGSSKDSFRIEYKATLTESACRNLAGRVAGKGRASGLTNVTVGTTSYATSDELNNLTSLSISGSCTNLSMTFTLKG